MRKLALLLLLAWTCLGCFVLPLPTRPLTLDGTRSATLDTGFLQEGRTTREEVAARWGPPTVWLQAQRIAVYGAVYSDVEIEFGSINGNGGSIPLHKREAVFLAFDGSERLARWDACRVQSGATWLGAALKWAHTAGLRVREPDLAFQPQAPPAGARVYFYCLKHPGVLGEPLPDVAMDGLRLGQIRRRTYLAVELPAGPHTFTLNPLSIRPNRASLRILDLPLTLEPGAVAYMEFHVACGINEPFSIVCVERPAEEALPVLRSLREAW